LYDCDAADNTNLNDNIIYCRCFKEYLIDLVGLTAKSLPAEEEEWYCSDNCRDNHAKNKTTVINIEVAARKEMNSSAKKKDIPRYVYIYFWNFVKL